MQPSELSTTVTVGGQPAPPNDASVHLQSATVLRLPEPVSSPRPCPDRRSKYIWYWQAPLLPELQLSADDFDEIEGYFRRPPKGVRNPGALLNGCRIRLTQQASSAPNTERIVVWGRALS